MERQFPKNVKQIGNVSDSPKIYVEDYVDTFLNQLCDKQAEEPRGAFLVGEKVTIDSQPCVYIYGAVKLCDIPMEGTSPQIGGELVNVAKEEKDKYFPDGELVGWFLSLPGQKAELSENIRKIHEKTFPKTNTVFIVRDTVAKEEMFFAYKYHDLLEIGGHYIYYEKNPAMQEYMVSTHKQNGVTPSEVVTDRAAKDFRSLVRDKMEKQEKKKGGHLTRAASMAVVIVAIVIGVTLFNNYDKMKSLQKSLPVMSTNINNGDKQARGEDAADDREKDGQVQGGSILEGEVQEGEKPDAGENADPAADPNQMPENTADPQQTGTLDGTEAAGQETQIPPEGQTGLGEGDEGAEGQEGQAVAASGNDVTAMYSDDDFYVVQKGDTLAKISKKLYGDGSHVEAICKMNGLEDGNLIFIGQKLLLP